MIEFIRILKIILYCESLFIKMKILIVCRLMSGFVDGIKNARWDPSGSPAFYKIIEKFDRNLDQLELVFTEKDSFGQSTVYKNDVIIKLRGLSAPITLLAGIERIPAWLGRWRYYLSEFRQTWRIFRILRSSKPDLLYIDRSNILAAAFIARFTRVPVLLRLLGVTPAMQELLSKPAFSHYLYRFAYRSRFRLVLCTEEGSPAMDWMNRALNPKTPRELWLNGVDVIPTNTQKKDKLHIIILGRLDPLKRIQECVEAILALPDSAIDKIQVDIIGTGILEKALRKQIESSPHKKCISFLAAVSHSKVKEYLATGDIYISLNVQGNLSNANLEAMKAGLCFILPEADPKTGVDIETVNVIPDSAAIRIGLNNLVGNLSGALLRLINSPDEIDLRKGAMRKAAEELVSWEERIDREYCLISKSVMINNEKIR